MRLDHQSREKLQALTMNVVMACLERLRDLRDAGFEFENRYYPAQKSAVSGQYSIVMWTSVGSVPKNFISPIGSKGGFKSEIEYDEIEEAVDLLDFVRQQPQLRKWLESARSDTDDMRELFLTWGVRDLPLEIVDRHVHIAGWAFDEDVAKGIYTELETWWLNEELSLELWIPILAISFDVEDFQLGDGCRLVRLSAEQQLARWPGHRLDGQEGVLAMATHALVVPGWIVNNDDASQWMRPVPPPDYVPQAEQFMQALAVMTQEPSGYLQVIGKPLGWAPGYVADLPVMLTGALVSDKCANRLKQAEKPLATIAQADLQHLRTAYNTMPQSAEVRLATDKLLSAERRLIEADQIVDLCVGLETLLSDSPGETTYKLAIRSVAMLAKAATPSPSHYMAAMKTIYGYRSDVVHGRKAGKNAKVEIAGQQWSSISLASMILRKVLQVRIANPTLDPKGIDTALLGAALDNFAATEIGL